MPASLTAAIRMSPNPSSAMICRKAVSSSRAARSGADGNSLDLVFGDQIPENCPGSRGFVHGLRWLAGWLGRRIRSRRYNQRLDCRSFGDDGAFRFDGLRRAADRKSRPRRDCSTAASSVSTGADGSTARFGYCFRRRPVRRRFPLLLREQRIDGRGFLPAFPGFPVRLGREFRRRVPPLLPPEAVARPVRVPVPVSATWSRLPGAFGAGRSGQV